MPFWKTSPRNDESADDRRPLSLLTDHAESKYNDRSVVTSPTGDRRTRHDARHDLRKKLFNVDVQELSTSDLDNGLASNETLASRATVSTLSPVPTSPIREKPRLEVESAIALLRELKKTASPDELAAIQNAFVELPLGSNATSQSSLPTEEQAINPLIRRKSIFTSPGAATRPRHLNVLKKTPPSKGKDGNKLYERADLEKQSALDSFMRDPKRHISGNGIIRTNTPSEFEYTHIGRYDFGTLRVTNGTSSPAPSAYTSQMQSRPSTSGLAKEEDYYTASEGRGTPSLKEDSIQSTPTGPDDENFDPTVVDRASTPTPTPAGQTDILRSMSPNRPPASPMGPRRFPLLRKGTDETVTTNISSIDRPISPRKMYLTEASSNPYLLDMTEAPSPSSEHNILAAAPSLVQLHDTLRVQSLDDDDESVYSSRSFKIPAESTYGTEADATFAVPQRVPSISSSVYTTDSLRRQPTTGTVIVKRDSGYSSESSLRKLYNVEQEEIVENSWEREQDPFQQAPAEYETKQPAFSPSPAQQRKDAERMHYLQPTPLAPPKFAPFTGTCLSPVPSSRIMYGLPQKAASSGDIAPYVTDLTPSDGSAPTTPDSKTKVKPNKLQKKRPWVDRGNSSPIIVQGQSPINGVPEIPFEVEKAHLKRMSINPDMNFLEQTFKSVKDSGRRMSTPDLPSTVNINFPSPSQSPIRHEPTPASSSRTRRRSWVMVGAAVLSGSRSKNGKERRRSLAAESDGVEGDYSQVADFGSVALSLGSGPYDIAQGRQRAPPAKHGMPVHPHQLGGNRSYRRSIGMDDQTASEYARMRSHDGVENFDDPVVVATRERRDMRAENRNSWGNRPTQPPVQPTESPPPPLPEIPSEKGARRIRSMYGSLKGTRDDESDWDMVVETGHPSPRRDGFSEPPSAEELTLPPERPPLLSHHSMPDVVRTGSKPHASTPPKGILKNSANNTPEDLSSWESSARLWRMRRKSIGEELRNRGTISPHVPDPDPEPQEYTPTKRSGNRILQAAKDGRISPERALPRLPASQSQSPHNLGDSVSALSYNSAESASYTPYNKGESASAIPSNSVESASAIPYARLPTSSPTKHESPVWPRAPLLPELNISSLTLDKYIPHKPARTGSPTPSVLERARAFELAESRNPSRPPSPSKMPLVLDPRAASPVRNKGLDMRRTREDTPPALKSGRYYAALKQNYPTAQTHRNQAHQNYNPSQTPSPMSNSGSGSNSGSNSGTRRDSRGMRLGLMAGHLRTASQELYQ